MEGILSSAFGRNNCQFRLTTDPSVGYPILDESTFKYDGANAPKDTRDDIVHLTLWHYTETGEPQLAMTRGMTYRVPPNAPRGLRRGISSRRSTSSAAMARGTPSSTGSHGSRSTPRRR